MDGGRIGDKKWWQMSCESGVCGLDGVICVGVLDGG